MSRWLICAASAISVWCDTSTACIDRIIVRPLGPVTTTDAVALELRIVTPTSPPQLVQPTRVIVEDSRVLVDLYADGGPIDSFASFRETVELGMLPAGAYTFEVTQHDTEYCAALTVSGSFCVEEAGCGDESCRCPEPPHPSHTIIDLGTLGYNPAAEASVALGINEAGQVAGGATSTDGYRHAFLWETGVMTDLGVLPPYPNTEAWDINESGHVVGISTANGGVADAFLWQDGYMINLGHLGGSNTHAFGVSDAGQIVGFSWAPHQSLMHSSGKTERCSTWGCSVARPAERGISTSLARSSAGCRRPPNNGRSCGKTAK